MLIPAAGNRMPEVKLMRLVVGDCGGLKQAREALYCGGGGGEVTLQIRSGTQGVTATTGVLYGGGAGTWHCWT